MPRVRTNGTFCPHVKCAYGPWRIWRLYVCGCQCHTWRGWRRKRAEGTIFERLSPDA